MNFLSWLKTKSKEPDKHPILGHEIEFAFEVNGERFYRFKKMESMPAKRWMEFLVKFEEMRMGVSMEWLNAWSDDILKLFAANKSTIDLSKVHEAVLELRARMKLSPKEDDIYAVASGAFFTLTENLTTYDFNENRLKIERWRKGEGPADFFYRQQVRDLIGFTTASKEAIQTTLEAEALKRMIIERKYLWRSEQP